MRNNCEATKGQTLEDFESFKLNQIECFGNKSMGMGEQLFPKEIMCVTLASHQSCQQKLEREMWLFGTDLCRTLLMGWNCMGDQQEF